MKRLTNEEMGQIEGGLSLMSLFSDLFNPATKNKSGSQPQTDPFEKNMRKMFGATAGRDLAKIAQKYGLVKIVNSIFGW
ncbi:hypothetical protein [Klebsiella grimontii]|uniref:hypothetical protein n=1 Tax=Klebsiella grimontii TaxID=2058152 RepID=UPI001867641E|nr:hypothetical protein [Klebsiella grimontii]